MFGLSWLLLLLSKETLYCLKPLGKRVARQPSNNRKCPKLKIKARRTGGHAGSKNWGACWGFGEVTLKSGRRGRRSSTHEVTSAREPLGHLLFASLTVQAHWAPLLPMPGLWLPSGHRPHSQMLLLLGKVPQTICLALAVK